ncbi:histidine--tRNA ligase [Vagococcus carniphilus]|uniref:Histidine--tRNA ligase n=1 Tax=Vagococcus carniphilus TaxID=218144 RepID=A0AAW8U905_9ENTE|nr:histidine--tRNA ligase [Vagococcus carniphilus]MDT2830375.1 histidine--tRNA ligase [Vagococcus carniphilus]MDT2834297.1 histidine--tRNA ligase [Vagococcus carniphilus]MDT2840056.1 histidine--tRNA ligase [Vagococcus carniphilus]MDT2847954.1 histidine--tRNA ligase [Vagococcus carniphilus]MDT2854547.1 histidine--tRNA ligase [Vagococcus carniphilus]
MGYQKPKGTVDILPGEVEKWQYVESVARSVFKKYDIHEMRTPMFEHIEVITRGVGDTTDIVTKEMYDFEDKGGRHITLRPENTAPLVRSYVENKLFGPEHQNPFKAFYIGPMFRYERPQAGRLRQFHQIGIEMIGSNNPTIDVEGILSALDFYKELGIEHTQLVINSLGTKECRMKYRQALIDYLEPKFDELSKDSQRRLHDNPLRVLDSKDEKDKVIVENAPSILDYLDEYSDKFFREVKELLDAVGVEYIVDHRMVRGLDYYNHTVFEIMSNAPGFNGAITTICAGGRYDGLVQELGGPETHDSAFGYALGLERAIITMEAEGVEVPTKPVVDVYVVGLGEKTNTESLKLVQAARNAGFVAERDYLNRKAKAQFKSADKLNAKVVLTIGEDELEKEVVRLKDMESKTEETIPLENIYTDFKHVIEKIINK